MSTELEGRRRMPDGEIPDLVLLLQPINNFKGVHVYGLGLDGNGEIIFKKLITFNRQTKLGIGYAVSGTKLFSVGSLFLEPNKEFRTWDLTDWRNRDENDFPVKCGETLEKKPRPLVFEFDGRIYALAGMGFPDNHNPNPVFEVFDPATDAWDPLPDPPFIRSYTEGYCSVVKSHTLIGTTFYVALAYYKNDAYGFSQGPWKYYSYDIPGRRWDTVNDNMDNVDDRVKNFIQHCRFQNVIRVDDNTTVFVCDRSMQVSACDLDADLEELIARRPSKKPIIPSEFDCFTMKPLDHEEEYGGEVVYVDDSDDESVPPELVLSNAFIPVRGLERVAEALPDERYSNSETVVHLTEDIYCLLYFYLPGDNKSQEDESEMVCITMFQAIRQSKEEGLIEAKVLASRCFHTDMTMYLETWCKFKSRV